MILQLVILMWLALSLLIIWLRNSLNHCLFFILLLAKNTFLIKVDNYFLTQHYVIFYHSSSPKLFPLGLVVIAQHINTSVTHCLTYVRNVTLWKSVSVSMLFLFNADQTQHCHSRGRMFCVQWSTAFLLFMNTTLVALFCT
jgi:hypothetical protein